MQGVEVVNQNLDVAVSRDRAVIEGIVLVEVAEAVDSSITRTCSAARGIISYYTFVEGVVRRVILYTDSIAIAATILSGY
jgi:hypothetical protein